MTYQSITRWQCPECGSYFDDQAKLHCLTETVARRYVALDALLALPRFLAIQQDREGYTEAGGWSHADPALEACIPVRFIEDVAKGGDA